MTRTLVALALLALPLAAQEKDAATRYHEAYVLEVIDGKTADAARAYLALTEAAATPDAIRAQAEFRFAVCAALLGRADEARARLAGLRTRDGLDAALRAQIQEYLRTLETVAPGSALQKRIEDLTFELGRETPQINKEPGVYRDFVTLGEKARPHLRLLLEHPDNRVREHAFRLLLRLSEPGMVEHWRPTYYASARDLNHYVRKHDDERVALEARLLDVPENRLINTLRQLEGPKWSAGFVKAMAARSDGIAKTVLPFARWRYQEPEVLAVLDGWLTGSPELAGATAQALLETAAHARRKAEALLTAERFRKVVAAVHATSLNSGAQTAGLAVWAKALDAGTVLAELEAWIDALEAGRLPVQLGLSNQPGDALAHALDAASLSAEQRSRYRAALVKWVAWVGENLQGWRHYAFGAHFRAALAGAKDTDTVLRALTAGPLRGPRVGWLQGFYDLTEVEGLRRFDTLLRVSDPDAQAVLIGQLAAVYLVPSAPPLAARRELARRGPSWLRLGSVATPKLPQALANAAVELPDGEAQAVLRACVAEALKLTEMNRTQVLGAWYSTSVNYGSRAHTRDFHARVSLPLAEEVVRQLPAQTRAWFVGILATQLRLDPRNPHREMLAGIVLRHVEDLRSHVNASVLLSDADLFPPEEWFHRVPIRVVLTHAVVESTIARLVQDPARAHPKLVATLCAHLGEKERAFVDALLEKGDAAAVARIAPAIDTDNVSGPVAERALGKLLASEPVDLGALGHLAQVVAHIRASDELVPVARRLLQASETAAVKQGIALARSLAKSELRADLVGLLDSPDANLRNAAREALESIAEWNRFKIEMKLAEKK